MPHDLKSILHGIGTPTTVEEFLQKDYPSLGLHIVQFTDSMTVTINWPHVLFDTLALADILQAWMLVLKGHVDKIQTPFGSDFDPLANLGASCEDRVTHSLINHQLSMPYLVSFGARTALRYLRSKTEHRVVYIPAWHLRSIREETIGELQSANPDQEMDFLSDGDILCAWWARHSVRHLDRSKDHGKSVVLSNAMSMRPALQKDLLPCAQHPFIGNSTAIISTLLKAEDVIDQPLGSTATRIRQSIIDLRRREQVEAFAALQRSSWKRIPPLFGDHKMHGIMISNWSKAKLFDIDFSGALPDFAKTAQEPRSARPVFVLNDFTGGDFVEVVVVMGKDGQGGYWLNCSTNKDRWPGIEAAMAAELKRHMDET